MRFVARPVVVDAFVINEISRDPHTGIFTVTMERDLGTFSVELKDGETARYVPEIGDMYVMQGDGYCYINPRHVFERKYTPQSNESLGSVMGLTGDRPRNEVYRGPSNQCDTRPRAER